MVVLAILCADYTESTRARIQGCRVPNAPDVHGYILYIHRMTVPRYGEIFQVLHDIETLNDRESITANRFQ